MADIDTAVQEQLDELRGAVHGIRRLLVANGGNPAPAPAATSHAGDAAILDALHELTDEVRRLRTNGVISEADAERIASCLESHFAIEEEPEPEGDDKKGGKPKGGKPKGENDGEETEPPKRRAYFRGSDDE